MSDFPIANILRQKRMFNPYNDRDDSSTPIDSTDLPFTMGDQSQDFGSVESDYGSLDPANDTYTIDQSVGTPSHGAYQTPDMSNPASDFFKQNMGQMPDRESMKLGLGGILLSALAGGLSGLSGAGIGQSIGVVKGMQNEKYENAMHDWEQKNKQAENLSNITYKGLNAKAHEANIRNKFISDSQKMDFNREKSIQVQDLNQKKLDEVTRQHDLQDTNADETRKATQAYRDRTGDYQNRMAGAAEKRADAALTNAKRPRTGNKGKPQAYYKNESEAKDAAFSDILTDTPEFGQYLDLETGSVLKDKTGQPVKKVGGKLYPLTDVDKQAIKNFNIQVRGRTQEFMKKVRDFSSDSSINELEDFDE